MAAMGGGFLPAVRNAAVDVANRKKRTFAEGGTELVKS
jgi:hypothetical protein